MNPLRFLLLLCAVLAMSAVASASAQTRPALLGQHRSSLVNVIDRELLLKRGQGDAILMFTCAIDPVGQGYGLQTYRESPDSGELKKHLLDRYQRALFVPALLHGRPQMVVMFGTVIFSVMEGKPRLVIFLNQEEEEIRQARDFIAPQVTFTAGSRFRGIFYPPGVKAAGAVAAAVDAWTLPAACADRA